MLKLPINLLEPGMVLAKPVIDPRGSILLRQGVTLTDEYIGNIHKRGFASIFVSDGDTDDVIVDDVLSEEVRRETQAVLSRVFDFVRRVSTEFANAHSDTVIAGLHDSGIINALRGYNGFEQLETLVNAIVEDIADQEMLPGSTQIRSHDDLIFNHSLDMTVVALMLGMQLNLKPIDLTRLGIGCLLHDIGKVFVNTSLLSDHIKSRKIPNPAILLRLKDHPRLGYEVLRARSPDAVVSNHVALEHHERQDGRGFPRRLYGTNAVERPRFDRQNILLIAEIATVADTFDTLSIERPGSPALTPKQITHTIHHLSGVFLNREIAGRLLKILPLLPMGINIIVRTGHYIGYRGVVLAANRKEPEYPTVRLLYNNQKERIAPIEIDLARDKTTTVEAIFHP